VLRDGRDGRGTPSTARALPHPVTTVWRVSRPTGRTAAPSTHTSLRGRGATMPGIAGPSWRRQVRRRAQARPARPRPPRRPPAGPRSPGPARTATAPMFHRCRPDDTHGPPVLPRPHGPAARRRSAHTSTAASITSRWTTGRIVAELAGAPSTGARVSQAPDDRAAGARAAATCHTVNVTSITKRRARRAGRLRHLSAIALQGSLPFSCRIAGLAWGAGATTPAYQGTCATSPRRPRPTRGACVPQPPVYRGTCATTPQRAHASRRVLAATCHTVNVALVLDRCSPRPDGLAWRT
jgi:hypothetical protein